LQTQNIDKLVASGIRFDKFYANCPVCSPTRAALLTGRYPDFVGVPGVIRTHVANNWGYLDPRAVLLPQLLKQAGYHTAIIGKMAPRPKLAQHPQRTRLRPLPRLPRRYDG
jgi:arylsulfatase A-like enzyme